MTASCCSDDRSPLIAACEHVLKPNGSVIGREVADTILPKFPTFATAIPTSRPCKLAIASIDGRKPIDHSRVHDFIVNEVGPLLHQMNIGRGQRVALILPNGPELALAICSIIHWTSCVPLNANGTKSELLADLKRCCPDLIIGPKISIDVNGATSATQPISKDSHAELFNVMPKSNDESSSFSGMAHIEEIASMLEIPFCGLIPSKIEAGTFQLVLPERTFDGRQIVSHEVVKPKSFFSSLLQSYEKQREAKPSSSSPPTPPTETTSLLSQESTSEYSSASSSTSLSTDENKSFDGNHFAPNEHLDEALVLFTSGTTGNKKLVPHTMGDMLVAAATIALSWNLGPDDVNCNLMPLFHVGGIVRQVFAPLLSGGCVICCPSFDPTIFWALLSRKAFNWYYAAPTMHHVILQIGKQSDEHGSTMIKSVKPELRMIANAAGGLLPSLAVELRETFKAFVLPSYGMTECMPISSPPFTYALEKPGTSGVPVGPEVAILDTKTLQPMKIDQEGPICVRGEPCFRGYGINFLEREANPSSTFLEGGWFNTGDLGFLDSDGYLYITGRAKEVINRGGEIISPMEVEEAVNGHPKVQAALAFSAPHDVLQEVVGIVIVPVPGKPKVDLTELHSYLGEDRLEPAKWPQCLVYMDALPKSHTNKVLRVKLSKRLCLPEISDKMAVVQRTFQAICPPQGASLDDPIVCGSVKASPVAVEKQLKEFLVKENNQMLIVVAHPFRIGSVVAHVYNIDRVELIETAIALLDSYAVPSHVCKMERYGMPRDALKDPTPADSVGAIIQSVRRTVVEIDSFTSGVQDLFQSLLSLEYLPSPEASFFSLGGGSMLASQLASKIRRYFGVPFAGAEVFHHTSCFAIASVVRARQNDGSKGSADESGFKMRQIDTQKAPFDSSRMETCNTWWKNLIQLVPLCVVLPTWQLSRFFFYFMLLLRVVGQIPNAPAFVNTSKAWGVDPYMIALIITLVSFHLLWITVTPLVFVAIKWIIIGRYSEGRFPLWSLYYLRWWFVDVCRKLVGRGIWGSNQVLLNFYYRLLGAKIGHGARVSLDAELAEFDLVTIGTDAAVEYSTVRAFGVDNGSFILGRVRVGNRASVGCRSVVAPYTSVPDDSHLGPVTSSYDVGAMHPKHAEYNRYTLPEPSLATQLLIGSPILTLITALEHLPGFLVLYWMVTMPFHYNIAGGSFGDLMEWLCDIRRVPFYIGIRVVRAIFAPLVRMACSILVKWFIIGKFRPGPRDTNSEWQLLRLWLSQVLFSRQNIQDVTELLGRHYELVSILYRLLGAKVGKRVFWPGHQPIFTGEFDLLEIGDDVVFGSRSAIFCTTPSSSEKVTLCAGSNLSDNSIVLPGGVLGKNSVLGSNSVCPAGWYLPESSVWFGSMSGEPVLLEKGVEGHLTTPSLACDQKVTMFQLEGDATTLRPFGRAFYLGQAKYQSYSLGFLVRYSVFCKAFIAAVHTFPVLGAIHITAALIYGFSVADRDFNGVHVSAPRFYFTLLSMMFFSNAIRVAIWVVVEVGAKWHFLGQRKEGRYDYDVSDYCQRWELYQLIAKIRNFGRMNLMEFIAGTPFLVSFFRLCGCRIGKEVCLYPAGGDPYMPEPDLVSIGDRCVVDMASIVCHLNTGGHFELAKIKLENNVTLRSRSRIQQGVIMEADSMLLEKSLAMTGEVLDAKSVWQGAPASQLFSYSSDSGTELREFGQSYQNEFSARLV